MIDNFTDEYGKLDLSDLDFSGYDLDIDISGIKTRGDIYQLRNKVGGELFQESKNNKR